MRLAIIPLIFALLAGIATAFQPGFNARAARAFGDRIHGGMLNFAVGLLTMLVVFSFARAFLGTPNPNFQEAAKGPWWMWLGGVFGSFFVTTAVFVMLKVGAGVYITTLIAGQITASLFIDQYGLMGLKQHPISPMKFIGLVLVVSGVALVMLSKPAPSPAS
jgi:bacterial/archaeal transporter family-2 protein